MASIRSATFFAAISSASSLLTSLEAADAAVLVLEAVLDAAPPQPVSTPAHRARAVTAAASFLVSIFLIVCLFLSCGMNYGLNRTKGTGKRDEKKALLSCGWHDKKALTVQSFFGTTNSS